MDGQGRENLGNKTAMGIKERKTKNTRRTKSRSVFLYYGDCYGIGRDESKNLRKNIYGLVDKKA